MASQVPTLGLHRRAAVTGTSPREEESMSWARGSTWPVTGLGVQVVDCCRDSGGGAEGPGSRERLQAKVRARRTGFSNDILPRFSRSKQPTPVVTSLPREVSGKGSVIDVGLGTGHLDTQWPCLVRSLPSGHARTTLWPGGAERSVPPADRPSWGCDAGPACSESTQPGPEAALT